VTRREEVETREYKLSETIKKRAGRIKIAEKKLREGIKKGLIRRRKVWEH